RHGGSLVAAYNTYCSAGHAVFTNLDAILNVPHWSGGRNPHRIAQEDGSRGHAASCANMTRAETAFVATTPAGMRPVLLARAAASILPACRGRRRRRPACA